MFPKITSSEPLPNALLIFTDGSSTDRAAYHYQDKTVSFNTPSKYAQLVELFPLLAVFQAFPHIPLNIYTDCAYLALSIPYLETVN